LSQSETTIATTGSNDTVRNRQKRPAAGRADAFWRAASCIEPATARFWLIVTWIEEGVYIDISIKTLKLQHGWRRE
jgi:hypothetical protein